MPRGWGDTDWGTSIFNVKGRIACVTGMAGGEYVQGFNSPVIIADCSTGSVGEEI
jgi:hypothetical protein